MNEALSINRSAPVSWQQDAKIMGLVGLAHASSHFGHLLLTPLFPFFMKEYALSFSQLGLLMTVFFVISGTGQAMAGFVVDKLGARPILFIALSLFMLACLLASTTTSYAGLLAVSALAGLGNASFHPVDFTILNQRISTARLGHAFSVHGLTGSLGWAAAPVFLIGIASISDWRSAYLAAAMLYACILALLFWQREALHTDVAPLHPQKTSLAQASVNDSAMGFLKLPVIWWCFGFFLLSTMTLSVIQGFSSSLLQAVHGVSLQAATYTLTAYMLCSAVGMLAGGFVAAHARHSDRVVAWCMCMGAALLALCATGALGGTGTMMVLAATGFAVGIGGPSRDMMIKKATPKGATGRVYGMVYSGLDIGFALSPLIFGTFMDRGWYAATLYGAATVLLLSVGAALAVGQRTVKA